MHPHVCLSPRVDGLEPSATLAIQQRCRQLEAEGRTVFRLGLGQSPFPVPAVVVEALQRHAHEKDYLPVAGLPVLREAIAGWLGRTIGVSAKASEIVVGPGSKELLFLVQLGLAGRLIIPAPSWVSYAPQAGLLNKPVSWVPTRREDGWRLTAAALASACEASPGPALLILNYPNNPLGTSYGADELEALAEVARAHGVIVLSDEIYGELDHRGAHVSIAQYLPEATLVSGGLSKWCGAGGWRLGFVHIPDALAPLRRAVEAAASETFTSVSAPIQHAAVTAFGEDASMVTYLERSRAVLRWLGPRCAVRLRSAGFDVPEPTGAFYLLPDAGPRRDALARRGIRTSTELAQRVLEETGVAFLPGTCFGRPPEELTVRLSYVDFDGEAALAAEDEDALRRACARTLEAIERMASWLESMG
jgi:aspartate aminotransferase